MLLSSIDLKMFVLHIIFLAVFVVFWKLGVLGGRTKKLLSFLILMLKMISNAPAQKNTKAGREPAPLPPPGVPG